MFFSLDLLGLAPTEVFILSSPANFQQSGFGQHSRQTTVFDLSCTMNSDSSDHTSDPSWDPDMSGDSQDLSEEAKYIML